MSTHDRIWAASGGEQYGDGYWTTNDVPDEGYTEYARLTPELLALIEAAKGFATAVEFSASKNVVLDTFALRGAAIAFAKSQDHPDAG